MRVSLLTEVVSNAEAREAKGAGRSDSADSSSALSNTASAMRDIIGLLRWIYRAWGADGNVKLISMLSANP